MIVVDDEIHSPGAWGPDALEEARKTNRDLQNSLAWERDKWIQDNRYFYDRLMRVLQFAIEPGKRVLELRCETGHMLASVAPSYGVGVEIGKAMVECAQ